mgnify:CR=1 FL=1
MIWREEPKQEDPHVHVVYFGHSHSLGINIIELSTPFLKPELSIDFWNNDLQRSTTEDPNVCVSFLVFSYLGITPQNYPSIFNINDLQSTTTAELPLNHLQSITTVEQPREHVHTEGVGLSTSS